MLIFITPIDKLRVKRRGGAKATLRLYSLRCFLFTNFHTKVEVGAKFPRTVFDSPSVTPRSVSASHSPHTSLSHSFSPDSYRAAFLWGC